MKLITEITEDVEYIEEANATTGEKELYIEGVFLQGNIKNRNGRIYPESVLEKEVKRYTENYIDKNRAFGELNHPKGPTINLDRVSHIITELKKDGSNYIGKAKITKEGTGKIVRGLIESGASLGVSSRGLGSLKENSKGIMEVQSDFYLATAADIVADPSAPDAFVNGIMENVEWISEGGVFKQYEIEEIQDSIHSASSKELSEAKLRAFEKLLSKFS